jgi:hypothetical protein
VAPETVSRQVHGAARSTLVGEVDPPLVFFRTSHEHGRGREFAVVHDLLLRERALHRDQEDVGRNHQDRRHDQGRRPQGEGGLSRPSPKSDDRCDRRIESDESDDRVPDAQGRDHGESHRQGTENGSYRVSRVEHSDVRPQPPGARKIQSPGQRKRCPHEKRGHEEHGKAHDETQEQPLEPGATRDEIGQRAVQVGTRGVEEKSHRHAEPQEQLNRRESPERVGEPFGETGHDERTCRQSEQEGPQHRREGVGGVSQEERQEPCPSHLVAQRREARHRIREEHDQSLGGHGSGLRSCFPLGADLHGQWHLRTPPHDPGDTPDEEIDGRRNELRPPQSEPFDQNEPRQEATRHGPQGVDAVQPPHGGAQTRSLSSQEPRKSRERPSHEKRGEQEHRAAEHETRSVDCGPVPLPGAVNPLVDGKHGRQNQGQRDGVESDPDLESTEHRERPLDTVDLSAEPPGPESQPSHERGQDRAGGEEATPENQRQAPNPDDLVDETADAGEEKQSIDQRRRSGIAIDSGSTLHRSSPPAWGC